MAAYIMCNCTTSILKILTRGQRRLDKVMCTQYQTMELVKEAYQSIYCDEQKLIPPDPPKNLMQ